MELGLEGQVAIVTGASRGIGRAITLELVGHGVRVLAVSRGEADLAGLAAEAGGGVEILSCDVTNRLQLTALPARAVEQMGRLDIVVNNTGGAIRGPFVELSWEDWDAQIAKNLTATALLTQAAGPHLLEQGSGRVINIASTTSVRGVANLVSYCTMKGAVLQFTRALAVEWAGAGVTVNAVGPGAIATDSQRRLLQGPREDLAARLSRIPDGRMGRPEEVAAVVAFLASRHAAHITGAMFMIDGGESVQL